MRVRENVVGDVNVARDRLEGTATCGGVKSGTFGVTGVGDTTSPGANVRVSGSTAVTIVSGDTAGGPSRSAPAHAAVSAAKRARTTVLFMGKVPMSNGG